jgi:hypothetical protein
LIAAAILAAEGSYLIIPEGYTDAGAYTLSLAEVTPQPIEVDVPVSDDLETGAIYAFEGEAGQIVSIAMNEDNSGIDARLTLYGPDGVTLASNDDSSGGLNALIKAVVLPADGSYLIIPEGYSAAGAYTLSLVEVTPQAIEVDVPVSDDLENGTIYIFEGQAGQIVSIAMNEDNSGIDTRLTLQGADGVTLASNDDSSGGLNALIKAVVLPADGSYLIIPEGYSETGAYTLSLAGVTPQPIAFDVPVSDDLETGAIYSFEGQVGQIVSIAMTEDDSGIDPRLTLQGGDGALLASNDDSSGGTNALIKEVILPADGAYVIIPEGYSETGAYILQLEATTASPISVGQTVSADSASRTLWSFEGEAGQVVTITMTEDRSDIDPYLELFSQDGTLLISNDDTLDSRNSKIEAYTLPADGQYIIRATIYSGGIDGAYRLTLD